MSYRLTACGGENIDTGTQFPFVVGNSDYAEYLAWIAAGNTPEPADPSPAPDYSAMRSQAYREESDPLYFKSQRGEATTQEWLDKVAEIKARLPTS